MLHLKTLFIKYPTLITLSATIIASLLAYMQVIIIDNINMFVAIFWVVLLDFIFGAILAIKRHEFKTKKASKIVYYLSTYWAILFVVLSIEKAYPAAYWASEGIVLLYSYLSNYISTEKCCRNRVNPKWPTKRIAEKY
jgi:hypothetical protein